MMILGTILFLTCFSVTNAADIDSCLSVLRPAFTITEAVLLDVPARWPERRRLVDTERETFLRDAGYADSTGNIAKAIVAEVLEACTIGTSTLEVRLMRVRGIEGTTDENIYLAVLNGSEIRSRTLVASLQATCEATYLRACSMEQDFSIRVGQLRHDFNCSTDEFLSTEQLPGLTIRVRQDGTLSERVDGEQLEPETDEGEQ